MNSRCGPLPCLKRKRKKGLPVPMNSKFTKAAKKGERTIHLTNAKQYHVDTLVLVGADNVEGNEIRRIVAIGGSGGGSAAVSSGGGEVTPSVLEIHLEKLPIHLGPQLQP